MLSENVILYNTDGHPIYENDSKKLINRVENLTIGDHCWLGMNSRILKGTFISNGTIIGADAVVTGKHFTENCCLAGNPAKIVKENICWKRSDYNWIDNNV